MKFMRFTDPQNQCQNVMESFRKFLALLVYNLKNIMSKLVSTMH